MNKQQINSSFKAHIALIMGSYFRGIHKIDGATIVYGPVPSIIWNYAALINTTPDHVPAMVEQSCEELSKLGRHPSFYTEPSTEPEKQLIEYLKSKGFESTSAKWMFHNGKTIQNGKLPNGYRVARVSNQKEMLDFINVFNKAYEPIDPDYGHALFSGFVSPNRSIETAHLVGYLNNVPVSIATYHGSLGYGGIYNVGTLPEYRKKGYATALVQGLIGLSTRNNDHMLFLQCEDELEKYYGSMGFQSEFVGTIWYKIPQS